MLALQQDFSGFFFHSGKHLIKSFAAQVVVFILRS